LTRQVVGTLVLTVAVFTFVLLLGHVLKEVLTLLVHRQASLGAVCQALVLLIPFVLAFALPMGFLTATLLVFGRLSADQELTAARASGVSLVALVTPILALSVALSAVCAWINLQLAPQCRVAYKALLFRVATDRMAGLLPEGRFVEDFPGYVVYVGKRQRDHLEDIWVCKLDERQQGAGYWRAKRGQLQWDPAKRQLTLTLAEVTSYLLHDGVWNPVSSAEETLTFDLTAPQPNRQEPKLSEMTFQQLRTRLRELERLLRHWPAEQEPRHVAPTEIQRLLRTRFDPTTPVLVQMHRQVAFSFACLGFTLIGIPLGIRAHRRETTAGVAMALVLVLLYYSFIILGEALDNRADLAPHLLLWLPNFLFQAVGAVLLWRANAGG
jgi:lipopolysaccharide export system permease protein